MPRDASITPEVIAEYGQIAVKRVGKQEVMVEDYVAFAEEARASGRYYAAAIYYRLASLKAAPQARSHLYHALADEMQDRVTIQDEEG